MSEQEKSTGTQAIAKVAGPFSPDRYTEKDALAVGLPSPEGLNLLVKFSEQMVGTPFIPKGLAAGPNQAGNILAVIMTGREENFSPMESLRSYWISPDGRLAKYADAVMAKMRRADFKFPEQEFTATRAHLKAIRPNGEEFTSTLTIEEVPSSLKGKQIWKDWPQRMLKARVIGDVYRFLASDLGGPTYTAEELQDLDYTPADTAESDRKRAEVIAARDDMKVHLKSKPAEPPAPVVEVTTEKEEQPPTPETKPEPVAEIPSFKYGIHRVFTTGGNKERVIPTEEIPQAREEDAALRAQALANENNSPYVVYEINTKTGELQAKRRFEPPKPIKQAEKPAEKPVAASKAPTPAPSTSKSPSVFTAALKERLNPVVDLLKPLPVATAVTRSLAFFAGYFGIGLKDLPREISSYDVACEELEGCINADVNEFNAGPEEAGARRARWAKETRGYLEAQWPNHTHTVALGVKLARRWRLSPDNFQKWFEQKVISLNTMPVEDAHAYMRIMLATPVSRDGGNLLSCCNKHNVSIAEAVSQIEKRSLGCMLEVAEEKAIQNGIDAWIIAVKESLGEKTDEVSEPEEEDNLFDGLV
jgi:hypothetical protein